MSIAIFSFCIFLFPINHTHLNILLRVFFRASCCHYNFTWNVIILFTFLLFWLLSLQNIQVLYFVHQMYCALSSTLSPFMPQLISAPINILSPSYLPLLISESCQIYSFAIQNFTLSPSERTELEKHVKKDKMGAVRCNDAAVCLGSLDFRTLLNLVAMSVSQYGHFRGDSTSRVQDYSNYGTMLFYTCQQSN